MSNNNQYHRFYTEEKLLAYLQNKLPLAEKKRFEQALAQDLFLQDALDGLRETGINESKKIVGRINKKVSILSGSRKTKVIQFNGRLIAVAAAILLFIGVSFYLVNLTFNTQQNKLVVANNNQIEEEQQFPQIQIIPSEHEEIGSQKQEITQLPHAAQKSKTTSTGLATENALSDDKAIFELESKDNNNVDEPVEIDFGSLENETNSPTVAEIPANIGYDSKITSSDQSGDAEKVRKKQSNKNESGVTLNEVENGFKKEKNQEDQVYEIVEQMPQFIGGEAKMIAFISNSLVYPTLAITNAIEGIVIVSFVVNEDGSISNATIIRGIGGGCDEEAVRVIVNMPNWTPGFMNGNAVKVKYNLPVQFSLN